MQRADDDDEMTMGIWQAEHSDGVGGGLACVRAGGPSGLRNDLFAAAGSVMGCTYQKKSRTREPRSKAPTRFAGATDVPCFLIMS